MEKQFGKKKANRKRAVLALALLLGALAFVSYQRPKPQAPTPATAAAQPAKPNIIVIVADDLGWGDVSWHGGFGKTPVMDKLLAEGAELDQHYVYPSCTPTRTALMTGRYPGRFGRHAIDPSNLRAIPPGTATLASALKSAGYTTYMSGKWGMGSRPEWGPNAYGFDHSYGTLGPVADPWTHLYHAGPYLNTWHRDGRIFTEKGNATELVAAEAVRRIKEKKQPWFLYLPFHAVHTPVNAPARYKALYKDTLFSRNPVLHESRLRLAAMLSQLDAKIGDVVTALEETGQRSNTLIIFMSDNGGSPKEVNWFESDTPDSPLNSTNKPLRGRKGQLYEGGVRSASFANWPGVLAPQKYTGVMHAIDWLPTLSTLAGYPLEPNWKLEGVNQWPALTGREKPQENRIIYTALIKPYSLRQGDWKLIRNKRVELFNLREDPYEQRDRAAEEPQIVARLSKLLDEHIALDKPGIPKDLRCYPDDAMIRRQTKKILPAYCDEILKQH